MPGMETSVHDLRLVIRLRVPIILIDTADEPRALELFRRLAVAVGQPVMRWSVTGSLQRVDLDLQPQTHTKHPHQALGQIKGTGTPGIYLPPDFHPYLDDPAQVRMIKEIAPGYPEAQHTPVFISHGCALPEALGASRRQDAGELGPRRGKQMVPVVPGDESQN